MASIFAQRGLEVDAGERGFALLHNVLAGGEFAARTRLKEAFPLRVQADSH